jgi:hypothetical protein
LPPLIPFPLEKIIQSMKILRPLFPFLLEQATKNVSLLGSIAHVGGQNLLTSS